MRTTNEMDDVKRIETINEKTENRTDSIRQEYGFASDVELKECKYCRVMIPKKARVCPNCKMRLKSRWLLKTAAGLVLAAVIGMGSYCLSVYWGLADGSMLPVWFVRNITPASAVSMSVVEPMEAAASVAAVETSETTVEKIRAESEQKAASVSAESTKTAKGTEEEMSQNTAVKDTEDESGYRETATGDTFDNGSEETGKQDKTEEGQGKEPLEAVDESEKENAAGSTDENEDPRQQEKLEEDQEQEIPAEADEEEAAFRAECKQVGYKELLREQEDYLNAAVTVEVEVTCRVGGGLFDENTYYLCKAEEKDGIERYYIIRDDREEDDTLILEGDWIMVYGQLFGNCKVPAELIHTRPTVPAVSMRYLDLEEE